MWLIVRDKVKDFSCIVADLFHDMDGKLQCWLWLSWFSRDYIEDQEEQCLAMIRVILGAYMKAGIVDGSTSNIGLIDKAKRFNVSPCPLLSPITSKQEEHPMHILEVAREATEHKAICLIELIVNMKHWRVHASLKKCLLGRLHDNVKVHIIVAPFPGCSLTTTTAVSSHCDALSTRNICD